MHRTQELSDVMNKGDYFAVFNKGKRFLPAISEHKRQSQQRLRACVCVYAARPLD